MTPSRNRWPAGTAERLGACVPWQLVVADAVPRSGSETRTVAVVAPGPVPRWIFAGATIVGAVSSTTITACVAVAVLPAPSVAVQVTVVVPTAKTLPDGERVIVTAPVAPDVVGVPSNAFDNVAAHVVAPEEVTVTTSGGALMLRGGFTTSLSAVAVLLAKTSLGPAMYCAATVYVPACSGLSGRLMDTLFEVLRDCSVLIVEPSGRVTLNCTEPSGVAPVLLVTVAVIEGVPVVSVGFCEQVNVVVVETCFTTSPTAAALPVGTTPPRPGAHSGATAYMRGRR